MVIYYCSKCQRQNPRNQCEGCGRNLPATALRNIWSDARLPVSDIYRVGAVFRYLFLALLLLLALMLAAEYIYMGDRAFLFLSNSGVLPALLELYAAGVALGLLLLALQGKETVQFVLDPKGALKRTWIQPTRRRCWARFIRFDQKAVQLNAEGVPFLMAHEEYLAWQDVSRCRYRPHAGRISLYRPYAFLFMGLHVPREEYDGAAAMIAAKVKGRR